MRSNNQTFLFILSFVFLITGVPKAHAQNRLDYLNVIQKTMEDIQQTEREESAQRQLDAAANARRQGQAQQLQQIQAQEIAASQERQRIEQDIVRMKAEIAQKRKDLQEAQERKRDRDTLGKMPNPWAK